MPFAIEGLLVALAVTALVMWFAEPSARRLNLLDHPNKGRKDHAAPVPVTGGIAMVAGVCVAMIALLPMTPSIRAFLLASVMLLLVGLIDDLVDVRWYVRIGAQATAALILVYIGGVRIEQIGPLFGFGQMSLGGLSVPFTVFATVGLINAVNMVDGMDGLAGSLVLAALVMMTGAAWYSGNLPMVERLMILGGAVMAFLTWNVRLPWRRRARAFMGNAGSAFLGLMIAWVSFRLTQNPGHPVSPVLALWLLLLAAGIALPLAATLLVLLAGILALLLIVLLRVAVAVRALLVLLTGILPLHVVLLLLVPVTVAALVHADLSL